MAFTWNLVSRGTEADEALKNRFRQKIAKLEKHLKHYPPDTVHLQIVLERRAKKASSAVTLALRTPADIFQSQKSGVEPLTALDGASEKLERELESSEAGQRGEMLLKRQARRERPDAAKAVGFADQPMAEGAGPQKLEDMVRELFQKQYNAMLRHARRDIRYDELAGDLPAGAVDPRDIVDEAARQAEAKAGAKPRKMSWRVWFYHLIHEELRRQRQIFKQKQAKEVSVEEPRTLPEDTEAALLPGDLMVKKEVEPEVIKTEDIVANPEAVPPDQVVEEKELLEHLQGAIQSWPKAEREVFELYFVEGIEPEEIAAITGQPKEKVRESIASIQRRLRDELLEENATA
ncbi:MAG: putative sigma 54 modulation protein/ribosomal protein [Pedosphaera sp.]|nr:putative sigma 54 modulation protein/ribosomal protein [Pedosphaera sp.]